MVDASLRGIDPVVEGETAARCERFDRARGAEIRVEKEPGDELRPPALERGSQLGQVARDAALAVRRALDALDVEENDTATTGGRLPSDASP